MIGKIKVSFDYDGTLQKREIQQYAEELIKNGIDVWLVTTRYDDNHKHLYIGTSNDVNLQLHDDCNLIGIPEHKRIFTNMEWKAKTLKEHNFLWHLDDNPDEFHAMDQEGCKTHGVWVNQDYRGFCKKLMLDYIKA